MYITVRVTSPDSTTGIVPQQVLVKYDAAAFEAPTSADQCVVNPLALGAIVDLSMISSVGASDKKWGMLMDSEGKTYGSQWSMAPVTIRDNDTGSALEGTEHAFALQWSYPTNAATMVSPTGIDWDYAIPFKVKSDAAAKSYTFDAIADTGGGAAIEIYIPNSDPDTLTGQNLNSATTGKLYNSTAGVVLGSATVKVTTNEASIDIESGKVLDPKAGATIDVTLSKGTFNTDDLTSAVSLDPAVGGAVTSATKKSDTVATVTLDGTALAAGTNYKIKIADSVITANEKPAGGFETSNTFTVKAKITGSVAIDQATATYGDTQLTATYTKSGDHGTDAPHYQWYRGTTKVGTDSATYTLSKADVNQDIKVEVTDSTMYDKVESAAVKVNPKALNAPAADTNLGTVEAVLQNATTGLTKTGTYTFKTADGLIEGDAVTTTFTATYTATDVASTGSKELTATFEGTTLAGTDKDLYTFAGSSSSYKATGTVSAAGYQLATSTTTNKAITWKGDQATDPYVGTPGGTASGTVTLGAGESLSSLTASTGSVVVDDADAGEFTWTAPSTPITGLVNVTFTDSSAKEVIVTATIPAKEYDGTNAVVGTITLSDNTVDFGITGATYADAEVGDGKVVTLTAAKTEIEEGDTTYKLTTTTTGDIKKISDPTITATVADNTLKGTSKIEDVIAAIKAAPVKLDGVTYGEGESEGTVGTYFDDAAIIAALKAAYPECFTEGAEGEEGTWNFSSLANKDLDLHFDLSGVTTGKLYDHADLGTAKLDFHTKFKKNTSSSTSGVNLDAGGYGTVDTDVAELDSEGHVVDLPTVTTKAGVVFLGWTDEEGSKNVIDPETKVLEEDDTLYAVYAGYVAGDGNGKVRPAANVLRKELARMLLVAAGLYDRNEDYTAKAENNFPDMPKDGWSDNYLARAKELGIMNGDAETGKARPNAPINREEAAVMIVKTFKVMTENGATTDKLADFDKVSDWAQKFVAALYNNGTVNGYPEEEGENTFRPKTNISRQEVAVMINKYLGVTPAKAADIKADTAVKNPFTDIKATDWSYAHVMFASLSVPYTYYEDEITQPTRDE
ncbi:MAG: S-layer homology domain-containing protein [Acutalibacter sp.]|nr:S-layer homology domain-containing protein [Acutalibacter sp.]